MNRVFISSVCFVVACLLNLTPMFANEPPEPAPIVVTVELEPLWIYDIEVSSAKFQPSIDIQSPRLADGSIKGQPGVPSAEVDPVKGITKMASRIRFMPETGEGGTWKLTISSSDKKTSITRYKLTVDAQVTR
ncbi:MAG TPA: hypothetical protein DD473_12380 [Planctomycetaceae bacterium]|nr:hypothetical protein [Planctomycetaceae bacterium]